MKVRLILRDIAHLRFLCVLWLCGAAHVAWGQTTDATVTGRILDGQGEPLPGVTVQVRNESTGFSTVTVTNVDGRYTLQQLPLGRPYSIKVSYVGFAEQERTGYTINQGDRISADFALSESAQQLEEVEVRGDQLTNRIGRLGASTAITAREVNRLPATNRDFTSLANLAPLTNGTNIGSQLASSTNYLIDGMSSRNLLTSGVVGRGPYTLSLEAIREFEVVYNEYDVTQGRSGGGTVSAVTKTGTNDFTGTLFTYHRADWLASPYDIRGNERTVDFSTTQWGFSLGGPIVKDKLHFFLVFDRQDEAQPFFIADIQNDDDANGLGISRGALDSVITIGRELYGLGNGPQVGAFDRRRVANTIFARFDWQLNAKNVLTLRNNYSDWNNPNSVNDNSNINLFETWSNFSSRENSTVLSLRSSPSTRLLNELKVQYQHAEREFTPNDELPSANIPRAIVNVRSTTPNGTTSTRTVQFGGQRFTPELNRERSIQLVNTTYLNAGRFNFSFGTDNILTRLFTYISNEQNGRFFFNNLQELSEQNPFRYAREVPLRGRPDVNQWVLNLSAFAQARFAPHPHMETQFGLRYDVTSYLTPADYNPVVDRELGLRTDARITDWTKVQPRAQFTWDIGGRRRDVLRVGAGSFAAYVINYAQVNNIQNSGLNVAAIDVSRPPASTGQPNLVPRPDFVSYRNDPATAPGIPEGSPTVSTINLNDPNFKVPVIYKANVTYNRFVTDWLRLGINYLVSRTENNYVYLDGNLRENDDPLTFTLDNEAGRRVYVPASSIDPANGQTNNVLARKSEDVGRTLIFTNGARLRTHAIVLDAELRLPRNGNLTVSYTWNDARDNSSYNGNVANTSTFRPIKSDPRDLSEINYSDNQFRHKVVVFGSSPEVKGFSLSGRFSGIGGTRYSLVVAGDLNGDFVGQAGARNDLAYVFNPNDPNVAPAVREGIQQLLNDPENASADYMRESIGTIADRNGGENPFAGVIDLRLAKVFRTVKTQTLELSVDVFNFANMLNREWGGNFNLGNQQLLTIRGFNPETRQYNYAVNTNIGRTQRNGTPYQVQLGARYSF